MERSGIRDLPNELAGRVILVTGASRGLGRAVATACAAAGATVLICGRDVVALETLADEVEANGGLPAVIVPIDLEAATRDDFANVSAHIEARFGRLDGMVANAAILGELAPLTSYEPVTWARVFQVNVDSVFLLLQACVPLLVRADDAAVVLTLAEEGESARALGRLCRIQICLARLARHHDRGIRIPSRRKGSRCHTRATTYAAASQGISGHRSRVITCA